MRPRRGEWPRIETHAHTQRAGIKYQHTSDSEAEMSPVCRCAKMRIFCELGKNNWTRFIKTNTVVLCVFPFGGRCHKLGRKITEHFLIGGKRNYLAIVISTTSVWQWLLSFDANELMFIIRKKMVGHDCNLGFLLRRCKSWSNDHSVKSLEEDQAWASWWLSYNE